MGGPPRPRRRPSSKADSFAGFPETGRAFRAGGDLTTRLSRRSARLASPQQVERFKSETPNWKRLSLEEIGKHFQADYVICLEIESASLYEMGSSNQLYRGRFQANMTGWDRCLNSLSKN